MNKKSFIFVLTIALFLVLVGVLFIIYGNDTTKNKQDKTSSTINTTSDDASLNKNEYTLEDGTTFTIKVSYKTTKSSRTVNVSFDDTAELLSFGYPNYSNKKNDYDGMGVQSFVFTSDEDVTYELYDSGAGSITSTPVYFMNEGVDLGNNTYQVNLRNKFATSGITIFKFYSLKVTNSEGKEKIYTFNCQTVEPFSYSNGYINLNNIMVVLGDAEQAEISSDKTIKVTKDLNNIETTSSFGMKAEIKFDFK